MNAEEKKCQEHKTPCKSPVVLTSKEEGSKVFRKIVWICEIFYVQKMQDILEKNPKGVEPKELQKEHWTIYEDVKKLFDIEIKIQFGKVGTQDQHFRTVQNKIDSAWKFYGAKNQSNWIKCQDSLNLEELELEERKTSIADGQQKLLEVQQQSQPAIKPKTPQRSPRPQPAIKPKTPQRSPRPQPAIKPKTPQRSPRPQPRAHHGFTIKIQLTTRTQQGSPVDAETLYDTSPPQALPKQHPGLQCTSNPIK